MKTSRLETKKKNPAQHFGNCIEHQIPFSIEQELGETMVCLPFHKRAATLSFFLKCIACIEMATLPEQELDNDVVCPPFQKHGTMVSF